MIETNLTPTILLQRSWVPHTKQAAFCVVETTDNHFYAGVRVENVVYPLTIESAQSALATTKSQGKIASKIHIWIKDGAKPESSLAMYCSEFGLELVKHSFSEQIPVLSKPKIMENFEDFSINDWPEIANSASISHFLVAAMLKTDAGWLFGTNFEHPFLGLGLCAERTAFAMALSYGYSIKNELFIFTKNNALATPCGACRQVGSELLPNDATAYLVSNSTNITTVKWADLLPFPFVLKP